MASPNAHLPTPPSSSIRPASTEPVGASSSEPAQGTDRRSNVPRLEASSVLQVRSLTKRFGNFTALDGVDLEICAGEIHCLLGENGAGKSTLCNVIFGVHTPTLGELRLGGEAFRPRGPAHALQLGIAMVHQHFSLVGNLTALENIQLGRARGRLSKDDLRVKISSLADKYGLNVPLDRPVEDLSVGERQRVEVLKCLVTTPRLLVLDEPTAVLPPAEVNGLLDICRKVASDGCAVLLVTHKLAEIAAVAHRTTVLRRGKTVCTVNMQDADVGELVHAMVGREVKPLSTLRDVGVRRAARPEAPALRVDQLTLRDAEGATRLDVSFHVDPGEVVGLAGVEGNGQTQLGAVLAGMLTPSSGRVLLAGQDVTGLHPKQLTALGVGVVPEDRHSTGCHLDLSVSENLFLGQLDQFTRFGMLQRQRLVRAAEALLARFDVRGTPVQRMAELSGGNQQKVVLARELSLSPLRFLLAAQPTRGLDLGAVEAVYRAIRQAANAGAGVLLLSSELDELLAVCDRVLVIYRGSIVGETSAGTTDQHLVGEWMSGHRAAAEQAA